jgi:hypothetical protein
MTSSKTEGVKYDMGKPDLSLCPKVALEEMAKAFMIGEKKYGRYNYLKGMEVHRLVAAAMRHLTAFNEGEDYDPEYGTTKHLGHALASIAMILDMEANKTMKETRYVRGQGLKSENANQALQQAGDGVSALSGVSDAGCVHGAPGTTKG